MSYYANAQLYCRQLTYSIIYVEWFLRFFYLWYFYHMYSVLANKWVLKLCWIMKLKLIFLFLYYYRYERLRLKIMKLKQKRNCWIDQWYSKVLMVLCKDSFINNYVFVFKKRMNNSQFIFSHIDVSVRYTDIHTGLKKKNTIFVLLKTPHDLFVVWCVYSCDVYTYERLRNVLIWSDYRCEKNFTQ